jgi:hypothetical protein
MLAPIPEEPVETVGRRMISEEIPAVRFLASVGIVGAWTVSATGVGGGGACGVGAGACVLGAEKHMFLVFY